MNEDIEFLKELQNELKTQENDCQAAPRFWVIRDYKYDVTEKGYHDRVHVYDTYGADGGYEVEEFAKLILEGGSSCDLSSDELDELRSITAEYSIFRESNLLDWFEEKTDATIVFEKEVSVIKQNTLFLTKQEAKDHLKCNSHHYSNNAHTYAMTAWRAPKVARLLTILETFDWDSVNS